MIEIDLFSFLLGKKLAGDSEPITEELTVTENGTYTPSEGVDGFDEVVVNVSGGGGAKVKPMSISFKNSTDTEIDASNIDFSKSGIASMFMGCTKATSINLSGCIASGIDSIMQLFRNCQKLESVDVSGLDTSSVKYMQNAFYSCSSLTSLDLSSWDFSSITNIDDMFCNCSSLTLLDIRTMTILTNASDPFFNVPLDCHIIVKDETEKNNLLTYGAFTNVEIAES